MKKALETPLDFGMGRGEVHNVAGNHVELGVEQPDGGHFKHGLHLFEKVDVRLVFVLGLRLCKVDFVEVQLSGKRFLLFGFRFICSPLLFDNGIE